MTKATFDELRFNNSNLSNGQFLSSLIVKVLENMDLTILQSSTLGNLESTGTYHPSDDKLFPSFLEVLELAANEKVTELLGLLKKLPSAKKADDNPFLFYINGEKARKMDFFDVAIKGIRSIKGGGIKNKPYSEMTIDEYRQTLFSQTLTGQNLGNKLFGEVKFSGYKKYGAE